MTMQSSEARFSVTLKTAVGDLCTVRGDVFEEINTGVVELLGLIEKINTVQGHGPGQPVGVQTVQAQLGGQVIEQYQTAAGFQPQQPPAQQGVPVYQQAPPQQQYVQPAPAQVETLSDKWGKRYTYGLMDAPRMPNGEPYILKEWVSKDGKALAKWVDPMEGPKPYAANGRAKDENGPWAN